MHADVLLIMADISGYTRFMIANQTELEHSHAIISGLLEAIIGEVEIPLSVAKLEGDAVFLYAIKDDRVAERVRAKIARFFTALIEARRAGDVANVSVRRMPEYRRASPEAHHP